MSNTGLTETITLAGKEYEVREPSIAANRQFRKEVGPVLKEHLPAIMDKLNAELDEMPDLDNASGIAVIALEIGPLLVQALGSIDRMIALTYLGAPALEDDKKHIENEARLSEFFEAFLQVLKLNFPLQHWGRALMNSLTTSIPTSGLDAAATGLNSSGQNGNDDPIPITEVSADKKSAS